MHNDLAPPSSSATLALHPCACPMVQYEPKNRSRRRVFDVWPRRSAITPDAARIDVLVDAAFHAAMIFAASLSSSTRRHAVPTCAEQSGYLRYHNYACAICG
ncbi:hypothetical protein OAO87_01225 [bacterium]|nr:hypothetical protein [bacterium]